MAKVYAYPAIICGVCEDERLVIIKCVYVGRDTYTCEVCGTEYVEEKNSYIGEVEE